MFPRGAFSPVICCPSENALDRRAWAYRQRGRKARCSRFRHGRDLFESLSQSGSRATLSRAMRPLPDLLSSAEKIGWLVNRHHKAPLLIEARLIGVLITDSTSHAGVIVEAMLTRRERLFLKHRQPEHNPDAGTLNQGIQGSVSCGLERPGQRGQRGRCACALERGSRSITLPHMLSVR